MLDQPVTPSEFVALLNQTLEYAYPMVSIEGELSDFKVSKNRWVYFDLKDEFASVRFFGTVYMLPGPLEDGLLVQAVGSPRLHPKFGFSVNLQSIQPVGEGSLKKAAELLQRKLAAEGLFLEERKRALPVAPSRIGLITASSSAAYADFIKILDERWGGMEVSLIDVHVQGSRAPGEIIAAIEHFNQLKELPEVLVLTRGGGSLEDLAAFSDERVVRAVAASRIPMLVAIGHEVDISLAELAADKRASTPSNAAQLLVPDKAHELIVVRSRRDSLSRSLSDLMSRETTTVEADKSRLKANMESYLAKQTDRMRATKKLVELFNPRIALKRGYAIIQKNGRYIKSVKAIKIGDLLNLTLQDGTIQAQTKEVKSQNG